MGVMQLLNGAASTTSLNAQSDSDVVVAPANLAGFPALPQFTLVVRETGELMLVTALNVGSPNTWTVRRGFGGSVAVPIQAGNHLDYSVTREMLLGGFVSKLDEVVLTVDTVNPVITLTVPSWLPAGLLRGLRLHWIGVAIGAAGNAGFGVRFNNDASASYWTAYHYGGPGMSYGNWNSYSYARTMWIGRQASGQTMNCMTFSTIDIDGCFDPDRWTAWQGRQSMMEGNLTTQYIMYGAGQWKSQALVNTLVLGIDDSQNNVLGNGQLAAGFRATLYGVP